MNKINWKKEYFDYMDFLGREVEKGQEDYKELLKEELEDIIALNGLDELYENERELLKLLDINIEDSDVLVLEV